MELVADFAAPDCVRPGTWTMQYHRAATAEGWDLFDSCGSLSGPLQVQTFDTPEGDAADLGGEDEIAWVLVRSQRCEHHRVALEILKEANPLEYERIMQWPTIVHGHWDYDTDTVMWGEDE